MFLSRFLLFTRSITMLPYGQYEADDPYLFEGDIKLTRGQYHSIFHGIHLFSAREGRNWPNGTVPYVFSFKGFSKNKRKKVLKAMKTFHKHTCIRFKKKTIHDKYYINISEHNKSDECSSYIGRVWKGGQDVTLSSGCMIQGMYVLN